MTAARGDGRRADALREAIVNAVPSWVGLTHDEPHRLADALLAGPLASLIEAQETVNRVRALEVAMTATNAPGPVVSALRRALDGTQ